MDKLFSDEIFLKIFRYLPRLDLYRGFYNLNSRLNRIISESRVYFHSRLTEDEQLYILPYVDPKQIRAFTVCQAQYTYSKLDQCINIRALIFSPSPDYSIYSYVEPQLNLVQPAIFRHLKSLTIYVHSWTSDYIQLCFMVFNNEFVLLESVNLPYANGSCVNGIKTWSTNLKYVRIECCNKSMFYPLLDNLPNIKNFTGAFGTPDRKSLKNQCLSLTNLSFFNYDRSPTPDGYNSYSTMDFDEMMDLYQHLPNLETTHIYIFNSGSLETQMDNLNRILSNCPKLTSFDIFIVYRSGVNQAYLDQIKKRYPLFENCSACTWSTRRVYECRLEKN